MWHFREIATLDRLLQQAWNDACDNLATSSVVLPTMALRECLGRGFASQTRDRDFQGCENVRQM
jgi:hypothetical protein